MLPDILLIDNGSSQPAATLKLRELASELSALTQLKIAPVSLAHANKIPVSEINNAPAHIFIEYIAERLEQGQREFIVLPLFFGPSKAITSLLPQQIAELKQQFGEFDVKLADVIYPLPVGEPLLTDLLADYINKSHPESVDNVVLVDHGSPSPAVTAVRQHICEQLQARMPEIKLDQAVMERRQGMKYDFNGELLENWLEQKASSGARSVAVILLFFLPGRHAGKGGDIEEICQAAMEKFPDLKIQISPLISEHSSLVDILASRLGSLMPNK